MGLRWDFTPSEELPDDEHAIHVVMQAEVHASTTRHDEGEGGVQSYTRDSVGGDTVKREVVQSFTEPHPNLDAFAKEYGHGDNGRMMDDVGLRDDEPELQAAQPVAVHITGEPTLLRKSAEQRAREDECDPIDVLDDWMLLDGFNCDALHTAKVELEERREKRVWKRTVLEELERLAGEQMRLAAQAWERDAHSGGIHDVLDTMEPHAWQEAHPTAVAERYAEHVRGTEPGERVPKRAIEEAAENGRGLAEWGEVPAVEEFRRCDGFDPQVPVPDAREGPPELPSGGATAGGALDD